MRFPPFFFVFSSFFLLLPTARAADLECYLGRNPRGHLPFLQDVCQRYKFVAPPQCLKFTQGEVVTRDCDPSFLCERFNIRNQCIRNVPHANLYGEICCCSTDLCNGAPFLLSSPFTCFFLTLLLLIH
ncbi:hypothetical protein M3Y99_01767500 [Aphelenchoides fujianensis]|nr:hypothetical protein M3Y99_01767500 [Aphelenchoides fujianensis]